MLGYLLRLYENADLVKAKMIPYPFKALACRLHLGKIVEAVRICADNRRYHCRCINKLFFNDCANPAGGSGIDVSITDGTASCADADQRSVTSAAENRRSCFKSKLFRRLFGYSADHIGGLDYIGQMRHIDLKDIADRLAPALLALSGIIKQGCKGRILCHCEFIGASADKEVLNVKPFVSLFIIFRLVIFHPFIFVNRILYTARNRSRYRKRFQKRNDIRTCDLKTVSHIFLQLLLGTLIHIAHRSADRIAVFVNKNKSLHLRAERNACNLFRLDIRLCENLLGRGTHCVPPLLGILLGTAVFEYVKII